jgi:N-acetylmuramoyl-L-alanine amidase
MPTLDNGIVIEERWSSKNYTPHDQVPTTFLESRVISGCTVHHWGNMGQNIADVADFLCNNNTPTSAHFILQEDQVLCIVTPEDAAWHAGNAHGNAITVGIECRPEMTPGDLLTLESLIRWLESTYGELLIYKHMDWVATACPGLYASKIDEIVERVNNVSIAPAPVAVVPENHVTENQHGGCCCCAKC